MSDLTKRVVSRYSSLVSAAYPDTPQEEEELREYKKRMTAMISEMEKFAKSIDAFRDKMSGWLEDLPGGMLWEDVPDDLHGAMDALYDGLSKFRQYIGRLDRG